MSQSSKKQKNKPEETEIVNKISGGGILRAVVIILIIGIFVALFAFNNNKNSLEGKVWDVRTTMGSLDAKHHYIMYTDLACPYCNVFARAIMSQEEIFEKYYIEDKDILFEIRLTNFLKLYSGYDISMSQWSAEGAYCARNQDRFWDYYHLAQQTLWDDYYSKGIGGSKTSPKIEGMTEDYWYAIGEKLGLGEDFKKCYYEHETAAEITANAERTQRIIQGGLPYFKFEKFTTSGFDPSWGWDYAKQYLDAGLL